jgi:hypothetical protein
MESNNFTAFQKLFDDYVAKYLQKRNDSDYKQNINLKINHSKEVFKHAVKIAKTENLTEKQIFTAGLCGLFHDIGRFYQYYYFNTFKDTENLYHGQIGCDVIDKENFFADLDNDTIILIRKAVYAHGLISIPEKYSEEEKFFSKITRDADKCDIFSIVSKYYKETGPRNISLEYGLSTNPAISENVLKSFLNNFVVSKTDLKTLNDFKLLQISWIYDINFSYSKDYINKNNFLTIILNTITDNENKNKIINHLNNMCFQ